jgi:hypothetical protein
VRLLLDECVPRRLGRELVGHEVRSVAEMGWAGLRNGDLLRASEGRFDVFVTVDQNLAYQQNLAGSALAVLVLVAQTSDIDDLRPLVPRALDAIRTIRPGDVIRMGP